MDGWALNQQVHRRTGLFTAVSAGLGFITGQLVEVGALDSLIPVSIIFMLFPVMLEIDYQRLQQVFAQSKVIFLSIFTNFLFCPLLLWGIISMVAPYQPHYVLVGLVLYGLMPCGGMVPTFTSMMNGNASMALSIVAASFVLSLVGVPLWTWVLIGEMIPVPFKMMSTYLLMVIIMPLAAAMVTRRVFLKYRESARFEAFKESLKEKVTYGLFFLFFIIFAKNARTLAGNPGLILEVIPLAALYLLTNLTVTSFLSIRAAGRTGNAVALVFGGSVKNSALAMALAVSVFGSKEALVVAIAGPLAQLPLMLTYVRVGRLWFPLDKGEGMGDS
ncbi:MAG: bile acid:sodium symporter [Desulfarculaceae bacterium]|jgi:ACR3 family arsenite transporter